MTYLKLKVCGMRNSDNIKQLLALAPDYMGFIFYEKSPRNAAQVLDSELLMTFPETTLKTGVFVDASIDFILEKVKKYRLDALQLHGNETPQYILELKNSTTKYPLQIIKAFGIDENFDFGILKSYENVTDYFLFDTKGKNHGGNGVKFNWGLLKNKTITKPYFLSGGLDLEDMEDVLRFHKNNPLLYSLDVNSKFETAPGMKDIDKLKLLSDKIAESNS